MNRASPHAVVLLLVGFALGLSFLLVPRAGELGLIEFRSARIERAQKSFQARWDAGERSPSVIAMLSKIAIERGDVDRALELIQSYLGQHPRDLEALRLLARWQRQSQRIDEWRKTVVRILDLAPDIELERQLLDEYEAVGDATGARILLRRIVTRPDATSDDAVALAGYEAAFGDLRGAADVLQRRRLRVPADATPTFLALEVVLRVDAGQFDGAADSARAGLLVAKTQGDALAMLEPFDRVGRTDQADRLFDARVVPEDTPRALLALWAERAVERNRSRDVVARLGTTATDECAPPLVRALLRLGRFDDAVKLGNAAGRLLDEEAVEDLVRAAVLRSELPKLRPLLALQAPRFLEDRPLLAGEIALAEGHRDEALRWLDRAAEARGAAAADDELSLVDLALRLGRRTLALDRLVLLAPRRPIPDTVLFELASLFVEAGRIQEGLTLFERLKRENGDVASGRGWALLATYAGETEEVRNWLAAQPIEDLPPDLLQTIAARAAELRNGPLALVASDLLFRVRPDDIARETRASALLASDRAAEALPLAEALPAGVARDSLVRAALIALAPHDPTAAARILPQLEAELAAATTREGAIEQLFAIGRYDLIVQPLDLLAARDPARWFGSFADVAARAGRRDLVAARAAALVARQDLPRDVEKQLVYALLEPTHVQGQAPAQAQGDKLRAVPLLERLAVEEGGSWYDSLAELLTKAGRVAELDRFEASRASVATLADADRRGLASRLLERGNKRAAEPAMRRIALAARKAEDIDQLFYVWGPRPTQEQLAFAGEAARAAQGELQAVWLERLNDVAASTRAVDAVRGRSTVQAKVAGRALDAYVQALSQIRDRAALKTELARAIDEASAADRLHRLLELARQSNELGLARRAADRWARLFPADKFAQRELGLIAFEQEDWTTARAALERFHATDGDFDSEQFYGEILLRARDVAGARPWFTKALARIEAMAKPPYRARVVQAHLLHRVGREDDADRLYRALLTERPDDKDLRADYLQMLLELGRLDRARDVAGPR